MGYSSSSSFDLLALLQAEQKKWVKDNGIFDGIMIGKKNCYLKPSIENKNNDVHGNIGYAAPTSLHTPAVAAGSFTLPTNGCLQPQYLMAIPSCSAQQQQNSDDHQVSISPSHYETNGIIYHGSSSPNGYFYDASTSSIDFQSKLSSLLSFSNDATQIGYEYDLNSPTLFLPADQGFSILADEQDKASNSSLSMDPTTETVLPNKHQHGYYYYYQEEEEKEKENMYFNSSPVDSSNIKSNKGIIQQQQQEEPLGPEASSCFFDTSGYYTESTTPSTFSCHSSFSPTFIDDQQFYAQRDRDFYHDHEMHKKMSTNFVITENFSPVLLDDERSVIDDDGNVTRPILIDEGQHVSSLNNSHYFTTLMDQQEVNQILTTPLLSGLPSPPSHDAYIRGPTLSAQYISSTTSSKMSSIITSKKKEPIALCSKSITRKQIGKSSTGSIASLSSSSSSPRRQKQIDKRSSSLKKNIARHVRKNNFNINNNSTPCNTCGKTFSREQDRKRHESSVHIVEKQFKCEICKQKFPRKDSLQRHQRKKTDCRHTSKNKHKSRSTISAMVRHATTSFF